MTGLAPEKDREQSIADQLRALNVGFMERLQMTLGDAGFKYTTLVVVDYKL
ncbi:hypothetical protein [Pseudomonas parafulva]|uniref:hypothetical protein n=1 Tax=Pseudomonas parafulva TaxID=157782 RepID=UPI0012B58654|nr:hypothetical protein [Pseudomonas parafulva]